MMRLDKISYRGDNEGFKKFLKELEGKAELEELGEPAKENPVEADAPVPDWFLRELIAVSLVVFGSLVAGVVLLYALS